MAKFRKKPIVIEAFQLTQEYIDKVHIDAGVNSNQLGVEPIPNVWVYEKIADIRTLEGIMTAVIGDWIITGIKGEVYPCKPDIFAATYEKVLESEDEKEGPTAADESIDGGHANAA